MFIAFLFLLCLILTKLIFILIIPILFIILLFQKIGWPKNPKNLADEIKNEFKKNFKQYLNYLIIPSIILISIALSVNYYKFGSPFNTGYTQWFLEKNIFSGNMFEGVYGFLFDKQWGIFICFPVLIFSLFGFSRFYKKYKTDFVFSSLILIVFLLTYSMFINWKGEWSYGPRYLLFILPIMALPFIEVLENLSKKNKLLIFLIVTILGYSAILQINNNSLGFFTYYQLERNFSSEEFIFGERNNATEPVFRRINNYFKTRHLGKMNQDFYNYLKYGKKFYPLEQVRLIITEESFIIFEYNFQKRVRALGQSNYYWFP